MTTIDFVVKMMWERWKLSRGWYGDRKIIRKKYGYRALSSSWRSSPEIGETWEESLEMYIVFVDLLFDELSDLTVAEAAFTEK